MTNTWIDTSKAMTRPCLRLATIADLRTPWIAGICGGTGVVAPAEPVGEHLFTLLTDKMKITGRTPPRLISVYLAADTSYAVHVACSDDRRLFDQTRVLEAPVPQPRTIVDPFTKQKRVIPRYLDRQAPHYLFARAASSDPGFSALSREGPKSLQLELEHAGFGPEWRHRGFLKHPKAREFHKWWKSRNPDWYDYFIDNDYALEIGGWPQWRPRTIAGEPLPDPGTYLASWFWTVQSSVQLYLSDTDIVTGHVRASD